MRAQNKQIQNRYESCVWNLKSVCNKTNFRNFWCEFVLERKDAIILWICVRRNRFKLVQWWNYGSPLPRWMITYSIYSLGMIYKRFLGEETKCSFFGPHDFYLIDNLQTIKQIATLRDTRLIFHSQMNSKNIQKELRMEIGASWRTFRYFNNVLRKLWGALTRWCAERYLWWAEREVWGRISFIRGWNLRKPDDFT